MRTQRIIRIMLALAIGFCIAAALPAGGQKEAAGGPAEKKLIKLSHSHQADSQASEIHVAAEVFQKYVHDNSKTLEVKIYAANALGEERTIYEGIQIGGGASCVISGTAILNNFNQKIGVLDLPFLWKGYDHVHKVLDGEAGKMLAKELEGAGFKVLAWMDSWGYRNVVTSKKEVKKPEDLKGLKIRTIQTPVYVAALNAMGANATPMAFGEVYTAMQTGVLDGYEHGASVTKAQKLYEVAKYTALTRHLFGPLVMIYSGKEWAKLTPEEQAVVQKGALLARDEQRRLAPVKEDEAFAFLKEKGMVINEIDTSGFARNAVAIQDQIAAERKAADLLAAIRAVK
jgi:tripartite ATP-independent transporter DctP family solute receptor